MRTEADFKRITRCLDPLRALPFVQSIDVELEPTRLVDAHLKVKTQRRTFKLAATFKWSYLDQASLNGLIAQRSLMHDPLLLVARYIPAEAGERLRQLGINFVDEVGNLHLDLGGQFYVFIVGRKEKTPNVAERKTTATMVQVVFTLLVQENAINWPVRKLAETAGVGKSAAAEARQRLTQSGMLVEGDTGLQIRNRKALEDAFLGGYEQVLRPDLWLGVFRPLKHGPDILLRRIKNWADRSNSTWAAAGAQAAYALSCLQAGEHITVFLGEPQPQHLNLGLQLSEDQEGTVTLLRSFGTLFPWRIQAGTPIVHPLLIYAELLHEVEPKALEAAAHIRRKYLAK